MLVIISYAMPPICRPNRINISALIPIVKGRTGLPKGQIEIVLKTENKEPSDTGLESYTALGVSHPSDTDWKMSPKDRNAGFKAVSSVSEAEVARFVYQVHRFKHLTMLNDPKSKIAEALYSIFFDEEPLYEKIPEGTPNGLPPHEEKDIKIWGDCYDGDTCTISVNIPKECFSQGLWGFYGPMREGNIDAPEKGFIPDYAKDWVLKRFKDPDLQEKPPVKAKTKLIDTSIMVFRHLVKNQTFTDSELFRSLQLIATWHDYSSALNGQIINGFKNFIHLDKQSFLKTRESTIRFAGESVPDIPQHMCGIKQTYDPYLRRLITLLADPALIEEYLSNRFLADIYKNSSSAYTYYKGLIAQRASPLKESSNPDINALATLLGPDKLPPFEMIYNPQILFKIRQWAAKLFEKYPQYTNNWTLWRVLLGLVHDYQKYRGQDFPAFKEAGDIARNNGFGLWGAALTFKAQWEFNLGNPRYHPKDCLTGGLP